MEKLFLELYKSFEEKQELFIRAGLKSIAHIDKFRGQPFNPEQFEYYPLPALFIDWRIPSWQRNGKKYTGRLVLDFHLVTDPTWDTSSVSTNKAEGIRNVLYHTLTRKVLDNFSTVDTSKFLRTEETPMDAEVTNYHKLSYECEYYDPSMNENYVETLIEELFLSGYLAKRLK